MEKREPSCAVGRIINWSSHYGKNSTEGPEKLKTDLHKVEAKMEKKKKKKHPTKLRFGLKSSLSFLIFSKTANYVIYEWSLAGESA